MLHAGAQAYTYDKGYFYPGPAVKDVPLSMAPKESQDVIKEFGRPEYDGWLKEFPHDAVAAARGAGRGVRDLGRAGRRAEDRRSSRHVAHMACSPAIMPGACRCRLAERAIADVRDA